MIMVAGETVDEILQLLAGVEIGDPFGWDLDAGTGFRIPSHAWLPLAGAETAEAANLDLVAIAKTPHDAVEDGLHYNLGIFPRHFRDARDLFNQICFCHSHSAIPLGLFPRKRYYWRRNPALPGRTQYGRPLRTR